MDFPTIYTALNGIRARASPRARQIQLPGLGKLDQMLHVETQTATDYALKPEISYQKTVTSSFVPVSLFRPREPDNLEFGTQLGRQKNSRKPKLLKTTKFFEFTGTNAFSRIQSRLSWGIGFAQKPSVFRLTRISRFGDSGVGRNPFRQKRGRKSNLSEQCAIF